VAGVRIGLVLGGGGVRGAAWMIGALHGLVAETGWDPAAADLLLGTSAGAVVAALTAAGAAPWQAREPGHHELLEALLEAAVLRPEFALGRPGPGSLALVGRAWREGPSQVMKVVAGIAPRGFVSTAPIARLVRELGPAAWPAGRDLWIAATDYDSGERVVFGRAGAPAADPALAVAASCAIPGLYRPVGIDGRLYVDGGVNSGANLDLAAEAALDLVICANPLSSSTGDRGLVSRIRALLHQQLVPQMQAVERSGCDLVVLEPATESIRLIGVNPMSRRRGAEIGSTASHEVREYLRRPDVRDKLEPLGRS